SPAAVRVTFEENTVIEATIAFRLGDAGAQSAGAAGPELVILLRNYMENELTSESLAVGVESGRAVRIFNNIVDHYSEAFRVSGGPGRVERLAVANNLVLEPAAL